VVSYLGLAPAGTVFVGVMGRSAAVMAVVRV